MLKGAKQNRTVFALRDKLLEYVTAREHSERKGYSTTFKLSAPDIQGHKPRLYQGKTDHKGNFSNRPDRKVPFNLAAGASKSQMDHYMGRRRH